MFQFNTAGYPLFCLNLQKVEHFVKSEFVLVFNVLFLCENFETFLSLHISLYHCFPTGRWLALCWPTNSSSHYVHIVSKLSLWF